MHAGFSLEPAQTQYTITDLSYVEMEWKHTAYNNTAPVDLTLCYTSVR